MIAPTDTNLTDTGMVSVETDDSRHEWRTTTESIRVYRRPDHEDRSRRPDLSPVIVQAMRSVNALETQKRDNVADAAKRIGFRLYNHFGRFPPSVVVPDCNFTLNYAK